MTVPGSYYVYILASRKHGTLYVGITNDLRARLELHRSGKGSELVKKYGVTRPVYVEQFASPQEAMGPGLRRGDVLSQSERIKNTLASL